MTPAEYEKSASGGPYKGTPRSKIFLLKIGAKSPFTLTSGQQVIGTQWDSEKRILYAGNRQIKLSEIKKDKDMGGGGSGAGSDLTAYTESGQCYVSSIAYNVLKRKIKWEDLTLENLQKAAKFCDTGKTTLDDVIEKSPADWVQSYVKTANATYEQYKMSGTPVYFHRDSKFMNAIYDAKKKVHDADKQSKNPQAPGTFSNDKWNPGDIWQTTLREVPKLSTDSWGTLNADIYKLATEKKLLGVSLKKIGASAHIDEYNKPKTKPGGYNYEGFRVTSKTDKGGVPFFNSMDLYMNISGKEVQFRATSGEASWQGEIKGATAAGGKIGGGNVNFYLKKHTGKELFSDSEKEVVAFTKSKNFFTEFYALYKKHFKEAGISGNPVSLDEFIAYASAQAKTSPGYLFSKYMNMKFIDIFLSVTKSKRDEIVADFFRYAASNTDQSSYFIKVS
jgi:hypothetical protein